jgi:restriction system protein
MPRRSKAPADQLVDELGELLFVVPAWVGPVLALAVYILFGHILPAFADSSEKPVSMVAAGILPVLSVAAPLIVLGLWMRAEWKKWNCSKNRRNLLCRLTGIDSIRNLSWQEFEHLVGEAFRQKGFRVEERGGSGGDGGIDLVLHKDGEHVIVQCKQWKAWKVGVNRVRELFGVMVSEDASRAILVTTGRFTAEAKRFAEDKPLHLIEGESLARLINEVQDKSAPNVTRPVPIPLATRVTDQTPIQPSTPSNELVCPVCGSGMMERVARRGPNKGEPFLGCTRYPRCRGIRSIPSH